MKYGEGLWVVRGDMRVQFRDEAYPKTMGFEYNDGTGDVGELLLEDFTIDYVPPGASSALRMTIAGDPSHKIHENSFDFDFASIPWLFRMSVCDKADHRIRVGSLFHDMLHCTHTFSRKFTDRMLVEINEAYGMGWYKNKKIYAGVRVGGGGPWNSHSDEEIAMYRKLFRVTEILM